VEAIAPGSPLAPRLVSHPPSYLYKEPVTRGDDLVRIMVDTEFPPDFLHRFLQIFLGPVHPGLLLPVDIVHGKREKCLAIPVEGTSPDKFGGAVLPMKRGKVSGEIRDHLPPHGIPVSGPGISLQIGSRFNQGHL
jgi:hypothetical protein